MICWVHFGDLHITQDDGFESLNNFEALVADANKYMAKSVDFAFLPGDNANNGKPEQYHRIRSITNGLDTPLHIVPGDHDFEPGSLHAFHEALGAAQLPKSVPIAGRRCLFLDIVSPGSGGPDFRLGPAQTAWLQKELAQSAQDRERPVVFMHAFPGDLKEGGGEIANLFAEYNVAFVDTGHTHYNEVINDGAVIYAATRSTGQIEEGSHGFSIAAVDGTVASWRFKEIGEPWPFILITSPADERLITDPGAADQVLADNFSIRAKVFGEGVRQVCARIDNGEEIAMTKLAGEKSMWSVRYPKLDAGNHQIAVEAVDNHGVKTRDKISICAEQVQPAAGRRQRHAPGTDRHSVGEWRGHGLLGTQLGPNKNGKKW